MARYLHYFQNQEDFEEAYNSGQYEEPWTSFVNDSEKTVTFDRFNYDELKKMPLTFEITSNGNITWSYYNSRNYEDAHATIYYKKNDGEWTNMPRTLAVVSGDTVQFKGDNEQYGSDYGDAFYNSFSEATTAGFILKGITSSFSLLLPAETLAQNCYGRMFAACTSLTTAPELPATTLANYCYDAMFAGCASLVQAPELPAMTLAQSCYAYMFNGCASLTTAPELPATTLASSCYQYMFFKATSVTGWTTGNNGIPYNWEVEDDGVLMTMWIDDYPDESVLAQQFYGREYSSFDDYLDAYMRNPKLFGSNKFEYTNETVVYSGKTYYAWYCQELNIYYLTDTIDFNTLYNLSVEADYTNRNCPIYAALLSGDLSDDPYMLNYSDVGHILAKIEGSGTNLIMWIDDFPSPVSHFYDLQDYVEDGEIFGYDEYFTFLLNQNPSRDGKFKNYQGANKYCYYGETIEYDGNTYYLWKAADDSINYCVKYLLTSTVSYKELYHQSIEYNHENRVCPVYAFFTENKEMYKETDYDDEGYVLLKVKK